MTRKRHKPEGIASIVGQVIKKLDVKTHGSKEAILNAWHASVEEKARLHTRPVAIRRKVLTIEVDSSTWIYTLSMKKKDILDEMKRSIGKDKIQDIRFRMGEIT